MTAPTLSRRPRAAAFTLIELLVVMAIIGVLIGLLLGAVTKVREVGNRTSTVSDLNNLNMSCTKFKSDFGFYPPDSIRLPGVVPDPTWAGAAANTPERQSYEGYQKLLAMFPRWQIPGVGAAASAIGSVPTNTSTGIEFGTTLPAPSTVQRNANGLLLQGSQCLVFFLGGPELQGFTPSGPYSPAAGASSVKGPYFDFNASRLRTNPPAPAPAEPQYLNSYLDPYGTPYAYFSTGSGRNYFLTDSWVPPTPDGPAYTNPVRPYQDSTGKWVNMAGVQIISAGRNKRFGPGTVIGGTPVAVTARWVPGNAGYQMDGPPPIGDGGDDLANFNGGIQLGAAGN